jgi:hypothetical protein
MRRKHYAVPIKLLMTVHGSLYTAGAKIYLQSENKLEKVASLYIPAESKFKAGLVAIEQLLSEVEDGSSVSISGRFFGTEQKRITNKPNIARVIGEKRLTVHFFNSPFLVDRAELFELAKDAQKRKASLIADI